MSYDSMLAHVIEILRLKLSDNDGALAEDYEVIHTAVPARLDLNFLRRGRDQGNVLASGRATDRNGVLFLLPGVDILPSDRIRVTKGPTGTFEVEGSVDPVQDRWGETHHLEVGIREVAKPLGRS